MGDGLAKNNHYFRQTLAGFLQLMRKFQLLIFVFIITSSLIFLYQQLIFTQNNLITEVKYIIDQNNNAQQSYLHEINANITLLLNLQAKPSNIYQDNHSEKNTRNIDNFKKYEQLKLLYQALTNIEQPEILEKKLQDFNQISSPTLISKLDKVMVVDFKNILPNEEIILRLDNIKNNFAAVDSNKLSWWQKKFANVINISTAEAEEANYKNSIILLIIKKSLSNNDYQLALAEILNLNYPTNYKNEIEYLIDNLKVKAMIKHELTTIIDLLINYD
jgi:hypothetical protein